MKVQRQRKIFKKYFRTQHAAVQDLYPFELRCDIKRSIDSQTNNVEEPTDTKSMSRQQISRPTRNAPGIAGFLRISDVIQDVNETIPVE